ncbi:MAG: hypothetical protein K6F91_05740 [Ruminococcus sp.]|nr:hypothetical protein [Ruminococcus sp.]
MKMNTILAIVFLVLPIAIAVYNIRHNNGSTKKRIIITSAILGGLFVIALFLGVAEDMRLDGYKGDYILEANNGVLSSCFYEGEDSGYRIVKKTFPLGGDDFYAIPDSVDKPALTFMWDRCTLLTPKDEEGNEPKYIDLDEHKDCQLLNENAVILGDYSTLLLYTMVWLFVAFGGYQFVRFAITVRSNAFVQSDEKQADKKKTKPNKK